MQKYHYTPGEGTTSFLFHLTALHRFFPKPDGRTVCRSLFSFHPACGKTLCLTLLCVLLAHGIQGSDKASFFIRQISYNDEVTLDRRGIDSLYNTAEGQLELPTIREIEFEIGDQGGDLPETFEYQLAGFEDNWNKAYSKIVRYTNLKGRQYELRIRHLSTSESYLPFVFQVARPQPDSIREEWWFQPLLIFCILLILFAVAYFLALNRSRRNLRIEVVRNQIASDLHDDVGANLSAINNLTELLKKRYQVPGTEANKKILNKIKSYVKDTITNLQDTVWAINPLNDSIEELLEKMKDFTFLMLRAKDIDIDFKNFYSPEHPIQLDMQQRHAMFMMFKEVINNIVKHAQATEVAIEIRSQRSFLSIAVKDNGIGFDPLILYQGNGLKNFRKRAEENFIDLDLESAPGSGAKTRMKVHSLA